MKATSQGYARVVLNGIDVYLGRFGTQAAREKYNDTISQWLANNRQWPPPKSIATMAQLAEEYLEYAAHQYVKAGKTTGTYFQISRAMSLLCAAELDDLPIEQFGPLKLSEYRVFLAEHRSHANGRKTINGFVQAIVAMFKWAVSQELVPETNYRALKTLPPIRKNRPVPGSAVILRDGEKVEPVPAEHLSLVRAFLSPMLRAMVDLQLVTAMRPIELIGLRSRYLVPTVVEGVHAYTVPNDFNKLDAYGIVRTVFIGPRGWEILQPWLPSDPDAFIFSPALAKQMADGLRRSNRKLKITPSNDPDLRRIKKHKKNKGLKPNAALPGHRYSTDSYRRAIERACKRAGLSIDQWWTPGQLRHNAATHITESESIEVAQLLLGHSQIETTLIYNKVHDKRAATAAKKLG